MVMSSLQRHWLLSVVFAMGMCANWQKESTIVTSFSQVNGNGMVTTADENHRHHPTRRSRIPCQNGNHKDNNQFLCLNATSVDRSGVAAAASLRSSPPSQLPAHHSRPHLGGSGSGGLSTSRHNHFFLSSAIRQQHLLGGGGHYSGQKPPLQGRPEGLGWRKQKRDSGQQYGCPLECECKWRKGKQTLLCNQKQMDDFPTMEDPGFQVMDCRLELFKKLTPPPPPSFNP